MKTTIDNLRSLLRMTFRQLQAERKHTYSLMSQVAELEAKVLTYHHVVTEMLNQVVNTIYIRQRKILYIIFIIRIMNYMFKI